MYDYGARFYMPDIGRWGVIDQRSQYTHEAYSYVWNNPIFFNDPTGMTGEPCDSCPKPIRTTNIEPVVITVYRPIPLKPVVLDFSSAGTILSGVAVMRAPNPYLFLASLAATVITYNMPTINMPISAYKIENITYNPDESPGTFLDKLGNIDHTTDINGVTVPINDNGIMKPMDQSISLTDRTFDFAKKGTEKWGEEAEHKKGARKSTEKKHEKGQSRKGRDKGGEKGDKRRPYRNK